MSSESLKKQKRQSMPVRREDKRPTCPNALSSDPKDPSCWHGFLHHHLPLLTSPDAHTYGSPLLRHRPHQSDSVGFVHQKKTGEPRQKLTIHYTSCQNSGSQLWQRHLVEPETTLETKTSDRWPTPWTTSILSVPPSPHTVSPVLTFLLITLSHNPTQEGIPCWNKGQASHQKSSD